MRRRGPSARQVLQAAGVELESGLSISELRALDVRLGIRFVPEHCEFLRLHVPVGRGWPDWRGEADQLEELLAWPVEGVLFDVRENVFWPLTWGKRPLEEADALDVARRHLQAVPRLVPVYGHRYLPAEPAAGPAPVFSVHQTDVIYYGDDLRDYIDHEFGVTEEWTPRPATRVPFWSDLAEGAESEDL